MQTLYWHDYETWGVDPSIDRPSQFAGVRTDLDLEIIGEPLVEYCVPPVDILPHPQASLVTGITPQQALAQGLPEHLFAQAILKELSQPGTCGVGYNSIRFDDEVTRYMAFRNFYDPYEREWKNGNSRWDLIDMVRLCYALRPETLKWPMVDGRPSFRLELLSAENGIAHDSAHDAYSDVVATIELAKLVKQKQPLLYDYCFNLRNKNQVMGLIDIDAKKPLLHVSSMYSTERGCMTLVAPLAWHPTNKNAVIAVDLNSNIDLLESLTADEIRNNLFSSHDGLSGDRSRVALTSIQINKCPVLATPKLLDDSSAQRLKIDKQYLDDNWQRLTQWDLTDKLHQVYSEPNFEPRLDPERQLYEGFIKGADKPIMQSVRESTASSLASNSYIFEDNRLPELLFRYRARNFPHTLNASEKEQWLDFCKKRLVDGDEACQTLGEFQQTVFALRQEHTANQEILGLLSELEEYAYQLESSLEKETG